MKQTARKTNRDSNMELLRIVAMLLVMVVHANFRALPVPAMAEIAQNSTSAFLQYLTESISICAVDLFILLSGWYGLRPKVSRLAELLFQILFFGVVCFAISVAVEGHMPANALCTILMLGEGDYWFIKTYLALYIFSPVLNAFVRAATARQLILTLAAIYTFQWTFGWIFEATSWLRAGYSLPSFMALYLLARYMSVHHPPFTQLPRRTYFAAWLSATQLLSVIVFLCRKNFGVGGVLFFYNSPVVIFQAACLLLYFSKVTLQSRLVNWVAASVFAIYLTHSSSFLAVYYDGTIREWFSSLSRASFIGHAACLITAVFMLSILVDKVRIALWNALKFANGKLQLTRVLSELLNFRTP